jgi:uncharacterized protein (DUF58 family)
MLTEQIIRRVREIQIRTGRTVADVLAGEYVSVFRGSGMEFEEVRPYQPGDDVRTIDWNVTARAGSPFIKRYVEERQLTLLLMADVSASQDFGSASRSKRETAAEICALLAFSAIHNDDKVGLLLFHGDIEQYIPPRKGQRHALRVVREVLAHDGTDASAARAPRWWQRWLPGPKHRPARTPRQSTNIAGALEFIMSVNKRRTVCFVVSDFLDDNFDQAISQASRRHDVVGVLITDPNELNIPNVGIVNLVDAETGKVQLFDTGAPGFGAMMAERATDRVNTLKERLRRRGIDLIHINTTSSVVDPLIEFFRMREKRLRR